MRYLILFFAMIYSNLSLSCECLGYSLKSEWVGADFIGVIKVDDDFIPPSVSGEVKLVNGTVIDSWKGQLEIVEFQHDFNMCSLVLEPNGKYLVFLSDSGSGPKTSSCAPNLKYRTLFKGKEQRSLIEFLEGKRGT